MKISNTKLKFDAWLKTLSEEDSVRVQNFFYLVESKIDLPIEAQKERLIKDYRRAFLYYLDHFLTLDQIFQLLDPVHLGEFYIDDYETWFPLDNGAKLYPLSMNKYWMAVFRLSMYLEEDVVPEILQMALNFTIKRFPAFATTVKRGIFWHYLDGTRRHYPIELEQYSALSPIKISRSRSMTFRVMFFQKRISVEFFHILADGRGGMTFLKTLVNEYLRLLGHKVCYESQILNVDEPPKEEEWKNDFPALNLSKKVEKSKLNQGVQVKGRLARVRPCEILHFDFSSEKLVKVAKENQVSVTVLMIAFLAHAVARSTKASKGTVNLQIPIDLRRFFNPNTLRNNTLFAIIRIPLREVDDFPTLLVDIQKQLLDGMDFNKIQSSMKLTNKLVTALRFIPLFIKAPITRLGYKIFGDRLFSITLSNVGVVTLPEEYAKQVRKMDFVLGTLVSNRAGTSLVTFKDTTTLSIAKLTFDETFETRLLEVLKTFDLEPTIFGSDRYEI